MHFNCWVSRTAISYFEQHFHLQTGFGVVLSNLGQVKIIILSEFSALGPFQEIFGFIRTEETIENIRKLETNLFMN